jgi:Domain of unknown function (DUF4160)
MVTIHRAHGMRFTIYTTDHEPAHVHVIGDGELKVDLLGEDGLPALVWNIGMKTSDRRRAMDVVRDKQADFIARWREIHGDAA